MSRQNAEILAKAADVLDRDGWSKYTMHTPPGRHCVVGAIGVASGYHRILRVSRLLTVEPRRVAAHTEARQAFQDFLGVGEGNVPPWNDNPHRTQGEVVEALRLCAEKEAAS